MKKISVFLRPTAVDGVIEQLAAQGIHGITLTPVRGCGRQHGHYEFSPWTNTIDVVRKVKLELFVQDAEVEPILPDLQTGARTGRIGDGKIVVSP